MSRQEELEWWHNSTIIRFLLQDISLCDDSEVSDWTEGETIHACLACGCKFHNESHLDRHLSMKVVYINFKCEHCGPLLMYNKCELIYHTYGHGEPVKAFSLSDISISFLPTSAGDIMGTVRFEKFPSKFFHITDKTDKTDVTFISKYKFASYSALEEYGLAVVGAAITSNKISTATTDAVLGYLYDVPDVVEIRFRELSLRTYLGTPVPETIAAEIQPNTCSECRTVVRTSLDVHLNPRNKFWDSRIRCKYCQTVLATNCQLSAHERLHMKKAPFICPECGDRFINYDELFDHFLTRCLHLLKSAYFNCPDFLCRRVYTVVENLMGHLLNYHVERYAYCTSCSLICITRELMNQHRVQCDIVTVYKCSFCKENGKILYDIRSHLSNEHRMLLFARYGYHCTRCKRRNMELPTYINHLRDCTTEMLIKSRYRNQIHNHKINAQKITPETSGRNMVIDFDINRNNTNDANSCGDQEVVHPTSPVAVIQTEYGEKRLNPEVFGETSSAMTRPKNENSTVKSFEEGTLTVRSSTEESSSLRDFDEDTSVASTVGEEISVGPLPKKKKTSSYHCEQIVNTRLVNKDISDLKKFSGENLNSELVNTKTSSVKKQLFKEMASSTSVLDTEIIETENTDENLHIEDHFLLNESLPISVEINELSDAGKNEMDSAVDTGEGSDDFNISDSSSTENLTSEPVTVSQNDPIVTQTLGKQQEIYECGVCTYNSNIRKEFESHVLKHKVNNTEYQCLECGVCFAVKPTFAKHLIASHKIMDVERYINTHDCIDFEAVEDLRLRSVNPNYKKDQFDENECCVCEEKFDSKNELDLHFRVHGMVYLTKNKFGKTSK